MDNHGDRVDTNTMYKIKGSTKDKMAKRLYPPAQGIHGHDSPETDSDERSQERESFFRSDGALDKDK